MFSHLSIALFAIFSLVAFSKPLAFHTRAVSSIFYVDWNGQYLNLLHSEDGQNYTVLNDPHDGTFYGAAVYLNNTELYFAGGNSKGYPVIVPEERGDWLVGKLGASGTKGFSQKNGTLIFGNNTIYGAYTVSR